MLRFGRLFGLCCVAAVLVLVANTVAMTVRERGGELAVLRTIGWRDARLARLLLSESCALSLLGGVIGCAGAWLTIATTRLTLGVEGVLVGFALSPRLVATGLGVALFAGLLAAALPAWRATRAPIPVALKGA